MPTTTLPQPIIRPSLFQELAERMRTMIAEGDLPPGGKIPEKDLCVAFGVSRTPLREAVKVLAQEGLVTLNPNRGATVSQITLDDLEEVFPIMGALEGLSGELACKNITSDEIAEIRQWHKAMVKHYECRELPEYFRCNQKIHELILLAARNETLFSSHRSLAGRVRRARYLANMSDARWARAIDEHENILAALEARDGEKLGPILKDHLKNKFETVQEWLESQH
jgi:DNA-binding GntR family transcriptional regulator